MVASQPAVWWHTSWTKLRLPQEHKGGCSFFLFVEPRFCWQQEKMCCGTQLSATEAFPEGLNPTPGKKITSSIHLHDKNPSQSDWMREEHGSIIPLNSLHSRVSVKVSFFLVIISLKFILATSHFFSTSCTSFFYSEKGWFPYSPSMCIAESKGWSLKDMWLEYNCINFSSYSRSTWEKSQGQVLFNKAKPVVTIV